MPHLVKPIVNWLAELASSLLALCWLVMWILLVLLWPPLSLIGLRRPQAQSVRLLWPMLALLILTCLFALFGCGTAPSTGSTNPRVPATLLVPPQEPVPLAPRAAASASKRPGPTTP